MNKYAEQVSGVCEVPNPQWARIGTTAPLTLNVVPIIGIYFILDDDDNDDFLCVIKAVSHLLYKNLFQN